MFPELGVLLLSLQGQLAVTYGQLIKDMWGAGRRKYIQVCPLEIKAQISTKAPQFHGFEAHDCHEFLSYLLDGLHEDLNRVLVKPMVDARIESRSRPDDVVAALSWEAYGKRNRSIITDLFHGQMRLRVTCSVCDCALPEWTTFEQGPAVTVPLPVNTDRNVLVRRRWLGCVTGGRVDDGSGGVCVCCRCHRGGPAAGYISPVPWWHSGAVQGDRTRVWVLRRPHAVVLGKLAVRTW